MDTKESNKLISKFMYPDWVHPKDNKENVQPYLDAVNGSFYVLAQLLAEDYEALKYHNSWDKLMTVIEKIQKLGYVTTISSNGAALRIVDPNDTVNITQNVVPTRWGHPKDFFRLTYEIVIDFIKWYNKHQNK